MTVETRTTIELGDVKAVEFECSNCHVKTIVPLNKFKQPPISCRGCNSEQWFVPGSEDFNDLIQMVRSMERFSKPNKLFSMRFDISPVASREGA
jgi:hypothetical protein